MIHGLTGSSIVFYKMFQQLSTNYKIIGIDLPGMGCSSRNPIKFTDYQSTADYYYFTDRVKYTLDALNIEKFTLLGHSFGGYISGIFTAKYPENVNKLILLSPVGIGTEMANISTSPVEDFIHKMLYKMKGPPTIGYKCLGIFSNFFFDFVIDHKCKNMNENGESEIFKGFMSCLFRNACVSEKAIFQFFDSNLRAYNPLVNNFKKLQEKRTIFFYGDRDWSPVSHAEMFKDFVPKTKIEIVPDSGHMLYSDNIDFLCDKILEFEYETQDLDSVSTDLVSSDSDK
jgi:cardiolipin-specific phospholipase